MEEIYKNFRISKNEFGYHEAVDLTDCDAYVLFAKTLEQLKTEIDEK